MSISRRLIPVTVVWGICVGELFLYLMGSTGMLFNRPGLDSLETITVLGILTATSTAFYYVYRTYGWKGALIVPPIGATMDMSFFRFPKILATDLLYSNAVLQAVFWSLVLIPPYLVTRFSRSTKARKKDPKS